MQQLNEQATQILIRAVDKLDSNLLDIRVPDFLTLRLQRLGLLETPQVIGYGFLMGLLYPQDPPLYEMQMIFLIVDRRHPRTKQGLFSAFPLSYLDEINGVTEVAGTIKKG